MFRSSFPTQSTTNTNFRTAFPKKFDPRSIQVPEVNVVKETFNPKNLFKSLFSKKIFGGLKEVGKIALELPKQTLYDPFKHPSEVTRTLETKAGFAPQGTPAQQAISAPLRYTGQAILRALTPLVEEYGTIIGRDVLAQRELANQTANQQPVVIGKQVESSVNELLKTNKASPAEIVNAVLASVPIALMISPFVARAARTQVLRLSDAIAKESRVPITRSDLQKITSSSSKAEAISRVGEVKYRAYQDATRTETVRQSLRDGYITLAEKQPTTFSNILKNSATRPITEIAQFGRTYGAPIKPSSIPAITERAGVSQVPTVAKAQAFKPFPAKIYASVTPKTAPIEARTSKVADTALAPTSFKTADDYVKAQGTPVYHGTNNDFIFQGRKEGAGESGFWTTNLKEAEKYAGDNGKINVAKFSDMPEDLRLGLTKQEYISQKTPHISVNKERAPQIIDTIKTRPQLIEEWNRAVKGDLTEDTPSKIARSIEQKAIEQQLTKGFENIAGYDKITIKDQAEKASRLLQDIEQTMRVIKGEDALPDGLRGSALITAAEQYIKQTGDVRMAYELANSPLVSETSAAAQELRLAAEREPDSLTRKLQDLKEARKKAIEKKKGSVKEIKAKDKADIKKEVKTPTKTEWNEFIESIKCT